MEDFEYLDISGDAGLRIYGKGLPDLFVNAARGLYSLITDTGSIRVDKTIQVIAAGETTESLLIAFLNELVFYLDAEGFIGRDIEIKSLKAESVEATVSGEEFDPDRHERRLLIKAATYHNITVEKMDGVWAASVIFDI